MECDFKSTQLVIQFAMCNVVAQYMYSLTLIGIVKVIWVALDKWCFQVLDKFINAKYILIRVVKEKIWYYKVFGLNNRTHILVLC